MGIKTIPRHIDGARSTSPVISYWCVLFVVAAVLMTGCATTQDRGDRAFQAKQYNQALDHYEMAIEEGNRDPEMYYHAAEAALKIGDFSLAERYYSRSLRHGGGEEVARALADFYISTSNYTKAVRVLQELLETTEDPQSVFNNLGAALMYAGLPLDAESYLLVAQQMRPADPVPYVNLGVLYDKHMHQPRLALGFYRCFLNLSRSSGQRRKIEARVKSLEMQHGKKVGERFDVPCDRPYQPPQPPSDDQIRNKLGNTQPPAGDESAAGDAPGDNDEDGGDAPADEQAQRDDDLPPPVIYRQVEDVPNGDDPEQAESGSAASEQGQSAQEISPRDRLRLAQEAFDAHNHREVIEHLEELPPSALDVSTMALYGRSLAALGEYKRAQRWLAGAVAEDANEQNVAALMETYRKLGATDKVHELCERLDEDASLAEVLEDCPKRQLMEHLKRKQQ